MKTEEKNPDTIAEELDPDWVNHWQDDDNKKEPNTKQLTF
jgi:hypothetical protein